jgi:mitogen-activated protein kinase kinase
MSPERLLGEKYDTSGDIWSVGITLLEIWNKQYPFSHVNDTPIDLHAELEKFRNKFDKYLPASKASPAMRRFIKSMLEVDPERRASCVDLAKSPWFDACVIYDLPSAQQVSTTFILNAF